MTDVAPDWRREAAPRRWRVFRAFLVLTSLPFFLRGFVLLSAPPVPLAFLAGILVLLVAANFCILELPPYRFLPLVTGFTVFGVFFIAGPATLALLAVAIAASEGLRRLVPRLAALGQRLGGPASEYAVPFATIGIILGSLDGLHAALGIAYPYPAVGAAAEIRLILMQVTIYALFLLLNEVSLHLRFGWRRVLGTAEGRGDLIIYLLVPFLGGPITSGIVVEYGPGLQYALLTYWWIVGGFGTFAIAAILVRRRLEIERLVGVIGRQERLAALGSLASIIAHQTRHHLGVLSMSAYVLGDTLAREPLSPAARASVGRELDAIARTRDELDRLLAQELRGRATPEEFGPLALARESGADLAPLTAARGVTLRYAGADTPIRGDRLRLKQAIANVVRNAIEASPRGGDVDVVLRHDAGDVCLSVRDHGCGLSATARAHLFEPLFTDKGDGLGMGLYVARAIVEAHGGTITVADTESGAGVEIRLVRGG